MILSCFKQLPPNFTLILVPIKFNEGARILSDVVGGLILSSDDPLDFHNEIKISNLFKISVHWLRQ